jgi:hypothetical protein
VVVVAKKPIPLRPVVPTDGALVEGARAGEMRAREALCRRYGPMVIGLSYRLLGRDDEAYDLAQEASRTPSPRSTDSTIRKRSRHG